MSLFEHSFVPALPHPLLIQEIHAMPGANMEVGWKGRIIDAPRSPSTPLFLTRPEEIVGCWRVSPDSPHAWRWPTHKVGA